jgi:hypothetical protein
MCPVTSKLHIARSDLLISKQQPEAKYTLGQNVQYRIRNNFGVNGEPSRAFRETPDPISIVSASPTIVEAILTRKLTQSKQPIE